MTVGKPGDKPKFPLEKFEGRLRAISRASPEVNAMRAEFSGSVKVANARVLDALALDANRGDFDAAASIKGDQNAIDTLRKGRGDATAAETEIEISAFGYLADENTVFADPTLTGRRGRLVTLRGTPRQLSAVGEKVVLSYVKLANTLHRPRPVTTGLSAAAAHPGPDRNPGRAGDNPAGGEGVLVGIIDVGGFDFAHPDFRVGGETRFVAIWDQGDDAYPPPKGFTYGSLLTAAHLAHGMATARSSGLAATEIMPQSEMTRGSHATHVASIAAGNHSLAPKAMIAGVLISLPESDYERRLSFYDTTRIVHAVEFLFDLADLMNAAGTRVTGVSINVSLGTNGGPHDDSAPMSRWIDHALTKPGRCVTVAAGNAGQEAPGDARDLGYMLGRVHTSGRLEATGLVRDLEWVVVGDGVEDISENELEIWYEPQDRFSVQLRPPGLPWMTVVHPSQYMQNIKLHDGTMVSIFNELYDAGNGCNRISIYLSPFLSRDKLAGVTPGIWGVRLIGTEIRDGRYHGWIERDDPADAGGDNAWRFPSFFASGSHVDDSTLSTLACGDRVIAVANYDDQTQRVNGSSSQGPTRDGRSKPDIAAPGTGIWAANGFDRDALWIAKTGTSMASPQVAGLIAAMLTQAPLLTSSQIMGIIRRTAIPLPGRAYSWQNDAGFGALNIAACLREAAGAATMKEVV